MRKIAFDEEELLVLAILEPDNRRNTDRQLEMILPEIKEDPDMEAIVISAAEKLSGSPMKPLPDWILKLIGKN